MGSPAAPRKNGIRCLPASPSHYRRHVGLPWGDVSDGFIGCQRSHQARRGCNNDYMEQPGTSNRGDDSETDIPMIDGVPLYEYLTEEQREGMYRRAQRAWEAAARQSVEELAAPDWPEVMSPGRS